MARHLLSVSAAVGLSADVQPADDALRSRWRQAGAVLVGVDQAAAVADLGLPRRPDVYVVGRDDDQAETHVWSTRLRAAVATVPAGAQDLAAALASLLAGSGSGRLLAVAGGSGGVGTSTLAAALAVTAARAGLRTLLVDADPAGGGIDIVLGAEHLSGWRWSRLAAARGHLGDLAGQLPHTDGVDVLAMDRDAQVGGALRPEQVAAVLGSASRSHDLTVVDLPRHAEPAHQEVLRRAGSVSLLVRADVRGVASADHTARALAPLCRVLGVIVRAGRGHGLDPALVADALDLPLVGTLGDDPSALAAAERGDPPGRSARSPLGRLCHELLLEPAEAAA